MIPRILVPVDVRPLDATDGAKAPARRLSSTLDLRTLLPRDMPIKQLEDNHSAIPDYVPLDVIVGRKLIDRGWHLDERTSASAPMRRLETSLDDRAVVPSIVERPSAEQVQKLETMPPLTADMLEVIEPDVMTTGDVNLLISPKEDRDARWNTASRFVSLTVHVGIILLALSSPEIFKHVPTDAEIASAKDQLRNIVYIPSDAPKNLLPPGPPGPKMHIAPGVIHKLAPPSIPAPAPSAAPAVPAPTPVQPKNDLPASITPRTPTPAPVQPQTNVSPSPAGLQPSSRTSPPASRPRRSSARTRVQFVVPGGDPRFCIVLPSGRAVWAESLTAATVGKPFSTHMSSAGGKAPIHWSVTSGKLPAGLAINSTTGGIAGTPTTKGKSSTSIQAKDSEPTPQTAAVTLPFTVK